METQVLTCEMKTMNAEMPIESVYECLCSKDSRNPMYADIFGDDESPPTPRIDCSCDNCFYGRDKLAIEILRLRTSEQKVEQEATIPFISTGEPSTLKTYRRMASILTGENSGATKYFDDKIQKQGEDEVVIQHESQMLMLIAQLAFMDSKD